MNIKTRICNVVQQQMEPYLKVQSLVEGRQHMCADPGNIWFLTFRIRMELVLSWSYSQAVSKPVWHIPLLCVQWKTLYDGQRNCSKHVEFYSKNKFEKLVCLFGFIIRIYGFLCYVSMSVTVFPIAGTVSLIDWCNYVHRNVKPYVAVWRLHWTTRLRQLWQ